MATRKSDKDTRKNKATDCSSSKQNNEEQSVEPSDDQFYVVGLGASAGGLETLELFFTNMPPDSGMAFVVVVHLDPTHKTLLPELLARYTRMDVSLAEEGVTVEPNNVYVIPANRDITLNEGQLHLEEPLSPRGMRHTIDIFLRSLAEDRVDHAIAVILSGTGTDGTQGVKAVKEAGGIVVVQDENSAKYPGMPQSAIATGVADIVISADKMPDKIIEITSRTPILTGTDGKASGKDVTDHLRKIFQIVNSRTGHDFSSYKTNTIMRRIERRMAVNNLDNLVDYISFLNEKADEAGALFKEILIGVTSFFRDPEAFEALREQVIPQIFKDRNPDDPVRVWLAGCATGEEAYSVAILLREFVRECRLEVKIQIFASDVDEVAIEHCRSGVYPDSISTDVNPERLRLFFRGTDSSYQVVKPLREMIVFAQHNLIKDPPFSKLDLLVCRNLLIYLNPEIQKSIIPLFFQALKPDSYLFLGTSETVGSNADLFRPLDKKWKLFQRRATGKRVDLEFPGGVPTRSVANKQAVQVGREEGLKPGSLAEKILIQRYSPPCAVINENLDVVYFSTRTSRFLEPPVGEPSQNIMKMAKEDLRPSLRAAIHKAFKDHENVVYENLKIHSGEQEEPFVLRVEPIKDPASAKGLALVIFEPSGKYVVPVPSAEKQVRRVEDEDEKDLLIRQLEEQLQITNDELQSTIERMETSNEELKSSNEELMSMNEEFQSTNEELETSKEELQALNEELVTVNAELESKIEELGQANNDMENLLSSSEIAIIFLDHQLRIKRYSPAMAKIFNLINSDIGRPLHHLSGKIDYPALSKDAEKVLDNLSVIEQEVSMPEGDRIFLMRVLPYRTMEDVIDGVVVTFIDITERKKSEIDQSHLAAIVKGASEAIIGITLEGKITSWNHGAEQIYGYTSEEMIGSNINRLVPPEKSDEATKILSKLKKGDGGKTLETVRCCKDGKKIDVSLSVSPVYDKQKNIIGASRISRDISRRKRLEADLRKSVDKEQSRRAEVEAILEAVPAAVLITHDAECKVITGNRTAHELLRIPAGGNTSKSDPEAPVEHFSVFHNGKELWPDNLPIQRVAKSGQPLWHFEEEILFDNGDRISLLGNIVPLLNTDGDAAGVVAAFIDISDRVQAEIALGKAKKTAEIASDAKDSFMANISHELRTPLTTTLGMLELLADTKLDEAQTKCHELANASGFALLRLIDDLLDFAKDGVGKLDIAQEPFALEKCVVDAVALMKDKASKKGLSLELDFGERLPRLVIGDCERLHQILFNLIGNAIKFTAEGKIQVTVEHTPSEDIPMCRFTVADTGIGIPEAELENIFDRFVQVDDSLSRSYAGAGLGLTISKNLVEKMGGAIKVESKVDKGSVFTFILPLKEATESTQKAESKVSTDLADSSFVQNCRILLAEDDVMIRNLMQIVFDKYDCDYSIVGNGAETLSASKTGSFDVILLDIQMPDMDGFEVVRQIRESEAEQEKHTPVIALTAHAFPEFKKRCLETGMDGYISKPIEVKELFSQIERVCKK